jgi:putative acetyltransferase
MPPTIRPYRSEDRAATKLVYFRAICEGTGNLYTDAERAAWAGSPEPDLTTPDKLLDQWCWVAEDDGRMTGFMSLCHDGLLDMAFVIPEVMGNGTAAALYDTLLAKARAEKLARLTVVASAQSRAFLIRRGWRLDREGPEVHDGQTYHLSYLSLQLIPG